MTETYIGIKHKSIALITYPLAYDAGVVQISNIVRFFCKQNHGLIMKYLVHISMSILANNIKISRSEKPQKNAKKPTICRIANVSWLDLETLLLHSYKPNRPTSTKILAQILFRYSSNIVVRLTSILTCYSSACVCLKVDATNKTVWKKFCLSKVS